MKLHAAVWSCLALAATFRSQQVEAGIACPEDKNCEGPFTCKTLEDLMRLLLCYAPEEDSEAYKLPSDPLKEDWKKVVTDMLNGIDCDSYVVPQSLQDAHYLVTKFLDEDDYRYYCVLAGFEPDEYDYYMAYPFGAVIVNQDTSAKDLSIDIPHPFNDYDTWLQGVAIFKGVTARSYTVSGSHRKANDEDSCQKGYKYKIADAAHNTNHTFQMNAVAIKEWYDGSGKDFKAIQFHGMGTSTCPDVDVYITHGYGQKPQENEAIDLLAKAFRDELDDDDEDGTAIVKIPNDTSTDCTLTGGTNTQGRYFNGVDLEDVCNEAQTGYSGNFIHIEQKRFIRTSEKYDQRWINALNNVDFSVAEPPAWPIRPSVSLTSFNDGGMMYRGDEIEITWVDDLPEDHHVKVSILDATETWLYNIAKLKPEENTGSIKWNVSNTDTIPEGENLLLRVRDENATSYKAISDVPFQVDGRIHITSDNSGSYDNGEFSEMIVTWTVTGVAYVRVDIFEVVDGKNIYYRDCKTTSVSGDAGSQGCSLKDLPAGSTYRMRVRDTTSLLRRAYSADFTITEAVTTTDSAAGAGGSDAGTRSGAGTGTEAVAKSLTLTSFNGGEELARGRETNLKFTWTSTGMAATDKVQLAFVKSDKSFNNYIVEETANTGSFILPEIRSWIKTGDILVRIRSVEIGGVKDTSIRAYSAAPITMLDFQYSFGIAKPVGGETYSEGSTVPIEWSWDGDMTGDVQVSLLKGKSWKDYVNKTRPIADGTSSDAIAWTVPKDLPDGNDYNIRIRWETNKRILEYSQRFTISNAEERN